MALDLQSEYMLNLSQESSYRYTSKLLNCGLKLDPYAMPEASWTREPEKLPPFTWSDIVIYMIATPSPYTQESIKAWKGMLDSEGFVASGLHDIKLHQYEVHDSSRFLIMGKVKHSQRVSAPPLLPWVVIHGDNGSVLAAHCNCMAGLGEACSHVASVLTCVVKGVQSRGNHQESCTSKPCSWLPVSKQVTPAAISDIKFINPKKMLEQEIDSDCSTTCTIPNNQSLSSSGIRADHYQTIVYCSNVWSHTVYYTLVNIIYYLMIVVHYPVIIVVWSM